MSCEIIYKCIHPETKNSPELLHVCRCDVKYILWNIRSFKVEVEDVNIHSFFFCFHYKHVGKKIIKKGAAHSNIVHCALSLFSL